MNQSLALGMFPWQPRVSACALLNYSLIIKCAGPGVGYVFFKNCAEQRNRDKEFEAERD